jgi:hypothetical protein
MPIAEKIIWRRIRYCDNSQKVRACLSLSNVPGISRFDLYKDGKPFWFTPESLCGMTQILHLVCCAPSPAVQLSYRQDTQGGSSVPLKTIRM